jgi:hypothetical protein
MAAGYRFLSNAICKGAECGARIEWWLMPERKGPSKRFTAPPQKIPMFAAGWGEQERLMPHFENCPALEAARKLKKEEAQKKRERQGSLF